MDEIYGNLENYDEVNAVVELRSENRELKSKLEQYTTSMDKLQKNILQDFDKLTSEFKKLEYNYSSLLKTARAEIERKTQIITNMNVEKDVLMCKVLQNGNRSLLNYKRDVAVMKSKLLKKDESGIDSVKPKTQEQPNCDSDNERIDGSAVSSDQKSGSINLNTERKFKKSNYDSYSGRGSESKENMHNDDVTNSSTKPRALGIKNRRKSMPTVSLQDAKLSSDDEECYRAEHAKEYSLKDNIDRNVPDRRYNHKYTNKISESSSMDDKTSGYHESSRETYSSRYSRHYDNDKYRGRDRYEYSQRYRRDLSPDRNNRRHVRDSNQRLEYSRSKVSKSPPKDKYNYSGRHIAHEPNYPRMYNEKHPHNKQDRYKPQQDRYSVKHKMVPDRDEPCSKRKKMNPYENHDDINWYERELAEQQKIAETFEQLESQYTSCQSPDYIHTDTSEPIKEIMNIALTQLEDPRVTSKKYSLKVYGDITLLSIVDDKNVDLKIIDKSMWGIQKVSVPAALLQQPTEGQIKHISLDSAASNMSTDSSEILYQQNYFVSGDSSTSKQKHQSTESYPVNNYKKLVSRDKLENNTQAEELQLKLIYDLPGPETSCGDIPEFIDKKQKESPSVIENSEEYNNCKNYEGKTKNCERQSPVKSIGNCSSSFYANKNTNRNNIITHDAICHDTKEIFDNKSYLPANKGVECDLELSDETCDSTDLQRINVNSSFNIKTPHDSRNSQDKNVKYNERTTKQKTCVLKEKVSESHIEINSYPSKNRNIEPIQKDAMVTEDKLKKLDTQDKVKSKKKSQKLKEEVGIFTSKNTENKHNKKTKRKKEKAKETKTKLLDLCGESSGNSLITPDDLGILTAEPKKHSTTYYTTISDDAQDGVELEGPNLVTENLVYAELIDGTNNVNPKNDALVLSEGNDIKTFMKNDEGNSGIKDGNVASTLSMIYENLEPLTKETDAVKTVIISTGCQPEVAIDEHSENYIERTNQNNKLKFPEALVNLLATSTPYKEIPQRNAIEPNATRIPDSSCNSNDSRFSNNITNSDALDSQNVTDAPDVRIFVRRKRRFLKKPLVT